jgi:hypothetical protein
MNFKNPWAKGGEYYPDWLGGEKALEGNINTLRGIIPGPDKLIFYKFDFNENIWWGMNDWRLKKYPDFKKKMDEVASYGKRIRNRVLKNFKIVDSQTRDNIIFSYNENDGEMPSFKLNMFYLTSSQTRTNLLVPFFGLEIDNNFGNNLYAMNWEYEISNINTNCFADVLGLVGTIDSEGTFVNLLTADGYKFNTFQENRKNMKVGDIVVFGLQGHAMLVTKTDSEGKAVLFTSNNRNMERLIDQTFEEINFLQFNDSLNFDANVFYARK